MSTYPAISGHVASMNSPRRCVANGLLSLFVAAVLTGCASSSSNSGSFVDKALDLVGLQAKPAVPDIPAMDAQSMPNLPKMSKKVTLRLHAGDVLNTDASGRSLSLVAKVYKLKEVDPFLQSTYEAFKETSSGKPAAIEGVVDVREVVLTPGQKYEVIETLPANVTHLAVVGMFRAPDDKRWRFVFDANEAAKSGITMGAHGCAWSVSQGQPVNAPAETLRLAGVRCR